MGIFTAILDIIAAYLKLKVLEEQNKYEDQFIALTNQYRTEISKPVWDGKDTITDPNTFRSDAALDNLLSQLCILSNAISTAPLKQ